MSLSFILKKIQHHPPANEARTRKPSLSFGAIAGGGRDNTFIDTRRDHQTTTPRLRVGATATSEIHGGGGVVPPKSPTTRRPRSRGGGKGRHTTSSGDLHLLPPHTSSSSFSRALGNMTRRFNDGGDGSATARQQQVHAAWFTPARLLALFCLMSMLIYVDRGAGVRGPPSDSIIPTLYIPIPSRRDGLVSVHSRSLKPHLSNLSCFVSFVVFFYSPRLHRRTIP